MKKRFRDVRAVSQEFKDVPEALRGFMGVLEKFLGCFKLFHGYSKGLGDVTVGFKGNINGNIRGCSLAFQRVSGAGMRNALKM